MFQVKITAMLSLVQREDYIKIEGYTTEGYK